MKTRHIIITIIGLFWLSIHFTQAQDYTVYQFQNRANGLFLSVADNQGSITLTEKTSENQINQCFFLKKSSNGHLLIGATQNPLLFLKKDGTFDQPNGNTDDFEWNIELADHTNRPAGEALYGVLRAVNGGANPVLGTNSGNNGTQLYSYPNDVVNDANERLCFIISTKTKIF